MGAPFIPPPAPLRDASGLSVTAAGGTVARQIKSVITDQCSILNFGADISGATDSTAALAAFIAYCASNNVSGLIPKGTLLVNPQDITVTGDLKITCHAVIKNAKAATATSRTLGLIGNYSNTLLWRGGFFDQNGGAFSALEINNWAAVDVETDGAANLTATPASTNTTAALSIANTPKWNAAWGRVSNFSQGTNTQGSIPRVFAVSVNNGVSSSGTINKGDSYNVHTHIVVGDLAGGTARIKGVNSDTHADNFVYNVGNAKRVILTNCNSIAGEEVIVNTGSGQVIWVGGTMEDFTNAAADWGHTGSTVGSVIVLGAYINSAVCANFIKSRPTNANISEVIFKNCIIDISPAYADDLTTGTVKKFVFEGNTYTLRYDTARQSGSKWMDFGPSGCSEFSFYGNTFELYNADGRMPIGDFFITLPNVTAPSRWKSNSLLNKTGNSAVNYRLTNARQQLVDFDGVFSVSNIQSEKEINAGGLATAPPRMVFGTAAPTSGYWPQGSVVTNPTAQNPNASAWVCTTAGTPGTWSPSNAINTVLRGVAGNQSFNLAAGATATTGVTVTGAAIGDFVVPPSFGAAQNGIVFDGYVSSANTVTVVARNTTAGTVSIGPASLRVDVFKV